MAINYRQPRQNDSLNPAYQMLVQAELAKAQAMSQVFDPLTKSILARRELAQRDREMSAEADWKSRYAQMQEAQLQQGQAKLGLEEKKLGLEQQEFDLKKGGNEALSMLLGASSGGGAPQSPAPAMASDPQSSMPFGGGGLSEMTRGGMVRPGGGEPQGLDYGGASTRHGPEFTQALQKLAQSRPDLAMAMLSHADLQDQREAGLEEKRQKAAFEQQEYQGALSALERVGPKSKRPLYDNTEYETVRSSMRDPVSRRSALDDMVKRRKTQLEDLRDETAAREQAKRYEKSLRADLRDDPEGAKKIGDYVAQSEGILTGAGKWSDKSKALDDLAGKVRGVGEKPEKSDVPFEFLKDDKNYTKGGFIEDAPESTKANVRMQAMKMASQQGLLRQDVLALAAGNPNFDKLSGFYDKMDAAEQDAVKTFENLLWKRAGWQSGVVDQSKLPGDIDPLSRPSSTQPPAPSQQGQQTQQSPLMDLTPEQRSEALKIHATGNREALKAFLLKARTSPNMKGSVMEQPKPTPKPRDQRGTMQ